MVVIINLFLKINNFTRIKNFRLRLISTFLLLFIFIIMFFLGNPILPLFLIVVFFAVLYEFNFICRNRLNFLNFIKISFFPILLFTLLLLQIFDIGQLTKNYSNYFLFLLIALITNFIFYYDYKNYLNFTMSILLVVSFFTLIKILFIPNGPDIFLYLVILVSVMDIFAYVGGNILGKYRIVPKISKGKTIEGTLIGLFFTILISVIIRGLIDLNILQAIIIGFSIGLLAFLGDLFESFFKRRIGIKDSGKIIPGHGGLLDRFDGYILILPLFNITLFY